MRYLRVRSTHCHVEGLVPSLSAAAALHPAPLAPLPIQNRQLRFCDELVSFTAARAAAPSLPERTAPSKQLPTPLRLSSLPAQRRSLR